MTSKLAAKNTVINWAYMLLNYFLSFAIRTLMIRYLGVEILGVNATIVETVSLLSFTELGIQSSITYKMYKPIIDGDSHRQQELFNLYRIAYLIVGVVIFILGLAVLPFLRAIVNTSVDMRIVYAAYIMQLGVTSLSYFSAYFRLLFITHQRQFVCTIYDMIINISILIIEIVTFVIYKNYLVFLGMSYLSWGANTAAIFLRAKKDYPDVIQRCAVQKQDIRELFHDMKEMLLGTISAYIYGSTDNILISGFFGSTVTGLISNYRMVTRIVRNVISNANTSITPAWGDFLHKEENKPRFKEYYEGFIFIEYCASLILLVPTIILTDDFIIIWLGQEFCIEPVILYLIIADIFFSNLNEPTCVILRSLGMFREDKIASVWAAIANITTSVILAKLVGVSGIFIGTVIAVLLYWVIRSWYVHIEVLDNPHLYLRFWANNAVYVLSFILITVVSSSLTQYIVFSAPILQFIARGMVIELIIIFYLWLIWRKSDRFIFVLNRIRAVIRK